MSVIRVVARITPLSDVSPNPPVFNVPSEFGDPISVETCHMTDPRTGLQYLVETTVIAKKYNFTTDISKELSTECENVPGFVCAQGDCPLLSPLPESDNGECPTLSFPKTIQQETISQLPERTRKLGPQTTSEISPSLKLRFNLKKIEKESKLISAQKKSQNLAKPLLRYFIEGECLICGFTVPVGTDPAEHLSTHISAKSYRCDCCKLPFANPKSLYLHKLNISGDCPYSCDICGTFYRRKHLLTVHQLKNHTEQFSQLTQNDESSVFRQNIPPCFSCSMCGDRLMTSDDLYLHSKLQCELRRFPNTGNKLSKDPWNQNGSGKDPGNQNGGGKDPGNQNGGGKDPGIPNADHRGENADKCVHGKKRGSGNCCQVINYQCVFCGKSFVSVKLVEQHTHVRVLSQKFPCKTCAEEFGSSRALQQHQRVHVKDPWICSLCGDNKKFYFEKTFLKHMRLIHAKN